MSYRSANGLGLLVKLLDDQLGGKMKLVDEKFIRFLRYDTDGVSRRGGKMSNVEGYDYIRARFSGAARTCRSPASLSIASIRCP